jgi:hypothetical protein
MKLIAKGVALAVAGLVSGAATASTVSSGTVNIFTGMYQEVVTLNSALPPIALDPIYYELSVGSQNVSTTFKLIDSDPDTHVVSYQLYDDLDGSSGISLGSLLESWSFTDLPSTASGGAITFLLGAGSQYVLKMSTDGAYSSSTAISAVPLPGAALLFGTALLGAGFSRRRKAASDRLAAATC